MDKSLEVLKLEINKLEVKPGELLAFRFTDGIHPEEIECFADRLKELLPDGVGAIFLDGDVELFVVSAKESKKSDE